MAFRILGIILLTTILTGVTQAADRRNSAKSCIHLLTAPYVRSVSFKDIRIIPFYNSLNDFKKLMFLKYIRKNRMAVAVDIRNHRSLINRTILKMIAKSTDYPSSWPLRTVLPIEELEKRFFAGIENHLKNEFNRTELKQLITDIHKFPEDATDFFFVTVNMLESQKPGLIQRVQETLQEEISHRKKAKLPTHSKPITDTPKRPKSQKTTTSSVSQHPRKLKLAKMSRDVSHLIKKSTATELLGNSLTKTLTDQFQEDCHALKNDIDQIRSGDVDGSSIKKAIKDKKQAVSRLKNRLNNITYFTTELATAEILLSPLAENRKSELINTVFETIENRLERDTLKNLPFGFLAQTSVGDLDPKSLDRLVTQFIQSWSREFTTQIKIDLQTSWQAILTREAASRVTKNYADGTISIQLNPNFYKLTRQMHLRIEAMLRSSSFSDQYLESTMILVEVLMDHSHRVKKDMQLISTEFAPPEFRVAKRWIEEIVRSETFDQLTGIGQRLVRDNYLHPMIGNFKSWWSIDAESGRKRRSKQRILFRISPDGRTLDIHHYEKTWDKPKSTR